MSSRDRKRVERRKRKQRGAGPIPEREREQAALGGEPSASAAAANGHAETVEDVAAEAERRGISRSELRNERAREELEPLAEGERPTIVTIGVVISVAIAASIVIAWLAGAKVDVRGSNLDQRPNPFQVFPPALLFAIMAWGMWRSRYWAVLGFEAIMAIIMVGSFITLVAATSVFKAISAGLVLIAAGLLFWFVVKALARIQMPEPGERKLR